MEWRIILTIAAFIGLISCAENFNEVVNKRLNEKLDILVNKGNPDSIQQPSGHWHIQGNDVPGTYQDRDWSVKDGKDGIPTSAAYQSYSPTEYEVETEENNGKTEDFEQIEIPRQKSVPYGEKVEASKIDEEEEEEYHEPEDLELEWDGQDDTLPNGSGLQLSGNILGMLGGLVTSIDPQVLLTNGINRKLSQIQNARKSILDFRDRALDQRVGTKQQDELNQFDPRFQESLTNNVDTWGISWSGLKDLIPNFQAQTEAVPENSATDVASHSLRNMLGMLRGIKEAVPLSNSIAAQQDDREESNPGGRLDRGHSFRNMLGGIKDFVSPDSNRRTEQRDENHESNRGGRQFLTSARKFATNPVGFVKRKVKDRIRQQVKNEIKESVGDIANRVMDFKGNINELASGLKDNLSPKNGSFVGRDNRHCLKIVSGLNSNTLYVDGREVPDCHIVHMDKDYPSDLHSHPVDHQDEVIKDCLVKGNILLLCQPDAVKVEEEHGRELEIIIAKDVVKDRVNGYVDKLFQRFGKQIMNGFHILKRDNVE